MVKHQNVQPQNHECLNVSLRQIARVARPILPLSTACRQTFFPRAKRGQRRVTLSWTTLSSSGWASRQPDSQSVPRHSDQMEPTERLLGLFGQVGCLFAGRNGGSCKSVDRTRSAKSAADRGAALAAGMKSNFSDLMTSVCPCLWARLHVRTDVYLINFALARYATRRCRSNLSLLLCGSRMLRCGNAWPYCRPHWRIAASLRSP